jgi:hypothetical protein
MEDVAQVLETVMLRDAVRQRDIAGLELSIVHLRIVNSSMAQVRHLVICGLLIPDVE